MADGIEIIIHDNSPEVKAAIRNAIKRGIRAIGEDAVSNAQRYIDIEHRIDTGTMRRSIAHSEANNFTVVGTDVYYAVFQELGTSRGIEPALFLTRAARNHTEEYKAKLKESIINA